MTPLFIIMRPEEPRYFSGFNGDDSQWNANPRWISENAFSCPVPLQLLEPTLQGLEDFDGLTVVVTTKEGYDAEVDKWTINQKMKLRQQGRLAE